MDEERGEKVTLSLADALEIGVAFHKQGWLKPAEEVYRAVLKLKPEEPNALHYLGMLHHQAGDSEAGVALIRAAIERRPDWFDAHNNLGNVLKESGSLDGAAAAYRRALEIAPGSPAVLNNLGVVLKSLGRIDEAEATLREAIAAAPASAEAWHNLGNVLVRARRTDEAAEAFGKAVKLSPERRASWRNFALSLARAGRMEDARRVFREWEAFEPDNASAKHMRAAILGDERPDRANDVYVRDLFDGMAGEFETRLAGLDYKAPEILARALEPVLGEPGGDLVVLDAGVGTGLCGPLLRPRASRLVGIDLSPKMIALAQARGVYDRTEVAELTAWLGDATERFDLLVSADTLVYFGALDAVFAGFARVLTPGGLLAFTLERSSDEGVADFRLEVHGRYSHREAYVVEILARSGFTDVRTERVVPRMELGEPVDGLLVLAKRGQVSH
jgi:predicted TPR repeat methyltransferase